jgi:hypothetical protein
MKFFASNKTKSALYCHSALVILSIYFWLERRKSCQTSTRFDQSKKKSFLCSAHLNRAERPRNSLNLAHSSMPDCLKITITNIYILLLIFTPSNMPLLYSFTSLVGSRRRSLSTSRSCHWRTASETAPCQLLILVRFQVARFQL